MNTTCQTPAAALLRSATAAPLSVRQRVAAALHDAWAAWRTRARLLDEQRTLEALSDATLRDIGLAERAAPRPLSGLDDYGRWGP